MSDPTSSPDATSSPPSTSRGRKVRNEIDARALLAVVRASDQPLQTWCRAHGVNASTRSERKRSPIPVRASSYQAAVKRCSHEAAG